MQSKQIIKMFVHDIIIIIIMMDNKPPKKSEASLFDGDPKRQFDAYQM